MGRDAIFMNRDGNSGVALVMVLAVLGALAIVGAPFVV
jgi:hypothetical protein